MKISILGLGYVGAVSLGCLARDGHDVVGADIDEAKVRLIQEGKTPIIEEGMAELMESVSKSGKVTVTMDAVEAVLNTDLSFICVGTPSAPNGGQDLTAIKRISQQLAEAIKLKSDYHVFIIRSTISPGTVENIIWPIIESGSNKKVGKDFGLGFQPEFLREGSSIKDYDNPPFTVVGTDSDRSSDLVREVFKHLPCEFITCSIKTAEMLKYCCNVFHALKATFSNEIGRISQSLGVDSHEVMQLVCKDKSLNISSAYMRPGFAFGGSCLPKDLRALMKLAKDNDISTPMLEHVLPSNRLHIDHTISLIKSKGKKSLGLIGLSFKSGTDDLRESPLVDLAEHFIGKGYDIKIYDPEVNIARLTGANKRYIEESIPHISSLMKESCREVIEESDIIVVGLNDIELIKELKNIVKADHYVIDLVNIADKDEIKADYQGICW